MNTYLSAKDQRSAACYSFFAPRRTFYVRLVTRKQITNHGYCFDFAFNRQIFIGSSLVHSVQSSIIIAIKEKQRTL